MKSQTSAKLIPKEDLTSEDRSEEINKNILIEGTPFRMVQFEKEVWAIMMGKYRITENPFKTEEEAMQYLETNHYNIYTAMFVIMLNDAIDHAKIMTKTPTENGTSY